MLHLPMVLPYFSVVHWNPNKGISYGHIKQLTTHKNNNIDLREHFRRKIVERVCPRRAMFNNTALATYQCRSLTPNLKSIQAQLYRN